MYSLLMLVTCSGLTFPTSGLYLCNGDVTKTIVHTLNNSKGQVRMMNKNTDFLLDYGNIFKDKGWWIFNKKIVVYKSQPLVLDLSKNNPLYLTISNMDNPTVYGRIESVKIENPLTNLAIECGEKLIRLDSGGELQGWRGQGVAICRALADSSLILKFNVTNTSVINIVSSDCQADEYENNTSQSFDVEIKVQEKLCNYSISQEDKDGLRQAIITVDGYSRTDIKITEPVAFDKKIFKPVLAISLEVEAYKGSEVIKRDSTKADALDVSWFTEGTLCAFAYSSIGQITTNCWNTNFDEVPVFFR